MDEQFSQYTYAQLAAMLAAARPGDVRTAGDAWRALATLLDGAVLTLEQEYARFQDLWEGAAAKAHARMVEALLEGLRQVAFAARTAADRVDTAREALDGAFDAMAGLSTPDAARAAAILTGLRDAYHSIEFPVVPDLADPPVPSPDGVPVYASTAVGKQPPLLSEFWRDGMIAAAGAPPSRFLPTYGLMPQRPVPQLFQPLVPPPSAPPLPSPASSSASLPPPSAPSADPPTPAPELVRAVGHSSLAPRADALAPSTLVGPAGVAGVGAPASGTPMMGGFIPPMMGGGAGSDLGRVDSRSSPPWLVETLTVFDATVEVVPGLVA